MKLEVNINKRNMFVLIAFVLVLAGVFVVYAVAPNPGHSAADVSYGSTDVNAALNELYNKFSSLETFSAGSTVIASSTALEQSRNKADFSTLKTFSVGQNGQVTLTFQYRTTHEDYKATPRVLRKRGNNVFVLVGPFNEHMLKSKSYDTYQAMKLEIENWLQQNNIACYIPPPLPSEFYRDASHPIAEGYALLAKQLFENASFKSFMDASAK